MTELEQPIQQQPLQPISVNTAKQPSLSKKKRLLILVGSLLTLIFLGVGAAAYNEIVINNPDKIWNQAIQNTTDGFETFTQVIGENTAKGGDVVGSINITEPVVASGNIEGSWYEDSAVYNSDISISGIKLDSEIRVIGNVDESTSPETYIKVNGVDGVLPLLSLIQPEIADALNTINGNWYLIDDSLLAKTSPETNELQKLSLTPEELADLSSRISNVIADRLLSIDESIAVIVVEQAIGREEFEGADTYKYVVKIQKQQLTDFITAIQEALKGTQFESILQNSTSYENGSIDSTQLYEMSSELNGLDISTMRAEAWVDVDSKYFRNVRIPITVDGTETANYIDIGLDYDGGDVYPFYIKLQQSTDSQGGSVNLKLTASIDKVSKETVLGFSVSGNSDSQNIAANGELKITPSDKQVDVVKPEGAKNAAELMNLLGQSNPFQLNDSSDNDFDLNTLQLDGIEL